MREVPAQASVSRFVKPSFLPPTGSPVQLFAATCARVVIATRALLLVFVDPPSSSCFLILFSQVEPAVPAAFEGDARLFGFVLTVFAVGSYLDKHCTSGGARTCVPMRGF